MAELEVILRDTAPSTLVEVRRCARCNNHCNDNSVCEIKSGDLHCRRQKRGEYFCYSYAPMRIGSFLKLVNLYIWIGILFCNFQLGAATNNTTDALNMTVMTEMTTIVVSTTELIETTSKKQEDSLPAWIIAVAVVGGLLVIAAIVIIAFFARKRCQCCSRPPSPVNKDFTPSVKGGKPYNQGFSGDTQGDATISMEPSTTAIDEPLYQNTAIGAQAQENPVFDATTPEDLPILPAPSPPFKGASNLSLASRPPLGIPSPFVLPQPGPGPALSSPIDDFPDRPPPEVPLAGSKMEDRTPLPQEPKKKEKKKKNTKDVKPIKQPQRYIDPDEQIREEVPMIKTTKPSSLDALRTVNAAPAIFDFSQTSPISANGDDYGGMYEDMSPVHRSPVKRWSPRQPDTDDFGDVYEDMNGGGEGEEYEMVDPNLPSQRPVGQARRPNQRQMVLPPVKSREEDFGGEYEVMSPNDHRTQDMNMDHRPQVPIPVQEPQEDFGGEYENPDQRKVFRKKKPPLAKPKTAKKPSNLPRDTDFGQDYGNTGPVKSFAASATQRPPPSLPSSSSLPDTPRGLPEGDDQTFPLPPSEQYPPTQSADGQDFGDIYDDTQVHKPSIAQKPTTQKPKVSPKPSSGGISSTLPHSPSKPLPLQSRSSASLPAGTEPIEENVYENFQATPDPKEKITRHYTNLPATEKKQEEINSSGYIFFSERPKQY